MESDWAAKLHNQLWCGQELWQFSLMLYKNGIVAKKYDEILTKSWVNKGNACQVMLKISFNSVVLLHKLSLYRTQIHVCLLCPWSPLIYLSIPPHCTSPSCPTQTWPYLGLWEGGSSRRGGPRLSPRQPTSKQSSKGSEGSHLFGQLPCYRWSRMQTHAS